MEKRIRASALKGVLYGPAVVKTSSLKLQQISHQPPHLHANLIPRTVVI